MSQGSGRATQSGIQTRTILHHYATWTSKVEEEEEKQEGVEEEPEQEEQERAVQEENKHAEKNRRRPPSRAMFPSLLASAAFAALPPCSVESRLHGSCGSALK